MQYLRRPAHTPGARDWGFLAPAFADSTCRPSDLDGCLEVNGRFLVLESKREGEATPEGQRRLLAALARLPEFTVVTVFGEPTCALQHWTAEGDGPIHPATDDNVIGLVAMWLTLARTARGGPRV